MEKAKRLRRCIPILGLLLLGTLAISCTSQPTSVQKSGDASRLTGTWVLTSKVVEGQDIPVTSRLMKLVFNSNGTFRAIYRGDEGQAWIGAGTGGFLYTPPLLTLFWDSGPAVTIVVQEKDPERLLFHHGNSLIPLNNQDPDEIFVRQKTDKGPTRQPS